MFKAICLLVGGVLFAGVSLAETQYFNAKVERVEVCKSNGGSVFLYFRNIVGVAPIATNGCSNDVAFPYVRLNETSGNLSDFDKAILSTALSAQAADRDVRVRFDDQTFEIESIAVD